MESTKFDDLTKALATSTSRRQALKTLAATTLGGILGLSGIGTSFAKNMTCAQWCAAVFGENTPADEQCSADAAHHTGFCYSCGPASSGGGVTPSAVCCPRTSGGYCTSYSNASCCGSGQQCCSGTCVNEQTDNNHCGSCQTVCSNGTNCQGGQCLCPGGVALCGSTCCSGSTPNCCSNTCTNTQSDASNCGTCGHVCASGQVCQNGTCVTPCSANGGTCNGDSDCCSDTCCQGTCCSSGQTCCNGSCCAACVTNSNGQTCLTACRAGCCICCDTLKESGSGSRYCSNCFTTRNPCNTSADCPQGQFCGSAGFCLATASC